MSVSNHQNSNKVIEDQLDERLVALEKHLNSDVIFFRGGISFGADDRIRAAIESRKKKKPKLTVILETEGGFIEVAQRMADLFRHHYKIVDFLIPNYAMSAGTVLVMSGDTIRMDYYSVLGPIDPQVKRADGKSIPAHGYIVQYERLIEKSKNNKITVAELQFLVEKFDPAELYAYEQAMKLSISLLKEWLVKYKFKDWNTTRTRKIKVTNKMRVDRAKLISKQLQDTQKWNSHGRGISMEVLRRDVNLEIDDFGSDPALSKKIKDYYWLALNYMARLGAESKVHVPNYLRCFQ